MASLNGALVECTLEESALDNLVIPLVFLTSPNRYHITLMDFLRPSKEKKAKKKKFLIHTLHVLNMVNIKTTSFVIYSVRICHIE